MKDMSKTHWKKVFDSEYLGAQDIEPGQELVVTIDRVTEGKIRGGQRDSTDTRNILHFKEKGVKPMVLNVTNSKAVKKVSGTNYIEEWPGTVVSIYAKNVKAFGEETDALRIKETKVRPRTAPTKITLHPGHEKWEAAVRFLSGEGKTLADVEAHYDATPENKKELCIQSAILMLKSGKTIQDVEAKFVFTDAEKENIIAQSL